MELQEAADRISLADRQKMANAAAMLSSAAPKAGQAADTSGRGPGEFRQACRDLETAARELSIAVASAESDSKLRDRSAQSCNWIFWRKKEQPEQFDDGGSLGEALLHHQPWPASTSTASGALDLAPGGHARPAPQDGRLWLQENLGEYLGYALFGSLTLLPYLDPEGQVMKLLSPNERYAFQFFFSVWWSAVSLGVPCKNSQNPALLQCASAANCIGMVGITALVIWYIYKLLAPDAPVSSYLVMAFACGLHVAAWLWDCKCLRGDGA